MKKDKKVKLEKIEKKENDQSKSKPILSSKTTAILYLFCFICWILSSIQNYLLKNYIKGSLDLGFSAILLILAINYYNRYKIGK